jgi:hypothetical protein
MTGKKTIPANPLGKKTESPKNNAAGLKSGGAFFCRADYRRIGGIGFRIIPQL